MLLSLLPSDPFISHINSMEISPYVGFINWVIPVGTCLTIGASWLLAITIFYAWSMLLRWAKVVGD